MTKNWLQPIPLKVYDITDKGFKICIHGKEYYLEREVYRWFLNATDEEILDVVAYPGDPNDHGDQLSWGLLNEDLGLKDLEDSERFFKYLWPDAYKERIKRFK